MQTKENNYAFIDSQNLNLSIQELGEHYSKAVIVTGDGDFHCLVKYLTKEEKNPVRTRP